MNLSAIAQHINAELIGDKNYEITGAGKIDEASSSEISFIANPVYEKYFLTTNAGAVIISKELYKKMADENRTNLLITDEPYLSFLSVLELLNPVKELLNEGIHSSSVIKSTATIGKSSVGVNCFIGEYCKIGTGSMIFHNTVILDNVQIGNNVTIYPNVTIYHDTQIGDNVIIHSGTVIGADGFGHVKDNDGTYKKIPQSGNVIIEDNVEIGSNCSIDRATMGSTRICKGVKLDNQIQIAHNVTIGENTVIAAQTGIAGSTKIGKNCMIGGQAGIVGHIEICDNVIITASVGVSKSINKPGIYSGYRAQPMKKQLKQDALIRNLEQIIHNLKNK